MKVSLLLKEKVMDWKKPNVTTDCFADFKCEVLLNAMANQDKFIYDCVQHVMEHRLETKEEIHYRQEVIKDCINQQDVIFQIYQVTEAAIQEIILNHRYILINDYPSIVLNNCIQKLRDYVKKYTEIKKSLLERKEKFHSKGFRTLIEKIEQVITPEFVKKVEEMMNRLEKNDRLTLEASLGVGYRAIDYRFCEKKKSFSKKSKGNPTSYKVSINNSDTRSVGYLLDLKQRGMEDTADIIACVVDEMNEFFLELHKELAFCCGCINLYQNLTKIGCKVVFPTVYETKEHQFCFRELYDVGLALSQQKQVVGNSLNLNPYDMIVITGANQGGKSTFLRSVGLAEIMFQCGMFVGAEQYESSICSGIYTHFRKDEDIKMNSGKLDDELRRFSEIIDQIKPGSILMCNESFSSTNEKEGSEIAVPILDAIVENQIKVLLVTHFYSIPKHYERLNREDVIILQAERKEDASRSFKMVEKGLDENSYGLDLYHQLFE